MSTRAALLHALGTLAEQTLSPLLERMLVAGARLWLEMAGAAFGSTEQQRFLDCLRELERGKAAASRDFLGRIHAGLAGLAQPDGRATSPMPTIDALELLSQEHVERELLIKAMASRVRARSQKTLFQLHERLLQVAARHFDEQENPLDPAFIALAFLDAFHALTPDPLTLKPFSAQFEVLVLGELDALWIQANRLLIDAGVLPDLSELLSRASPRPGPSHPVGATANDAPEPQPEPAVGDAGQGIGFLELAGLLGQLRSPTRSPGAPPAISAPPCNEQLVAWLSELQAQSGWLGSEPRAALDIPQAMASILASRGGVPLARADEDVVNLLALFFDTVVKDDSLPPEIKGLISRLQLPVLKLAFTDRSFFSDRNHPARRVIDLIARTGVGWDSQRMSQHDALLARLTETVDALSAVEGSGTPVSFADAHARLGEFAEQQEQRARKIERRTCEKAEADARTAAARDAVYAVLHERLDGVALPQPLVEFLTVDWQRVLQLRFLRKGRDSPEWADAVQLIDDLVRSVTAPVEAASRADYEKDLDALYQRLASGLAQTQSHTADAESRSSVIRGIHRSFVLGAADVTALAAPSQRVTVVPPPLLPPRNSPPPAPVPGRDPPGGALMFESLQRADAVAVGTWFEYDDPKSGATRRCKLAARIEDARMLVFSDRSGRPVAEKQRKAFAYELQLGLLRIIEDAPLVERTLGRIAENLRHPAISG